MGRGRHRLVPAVLVAAAALALAAACTSGDDGDGDRPSASTDGLACDWPMWGQSPDRTFSYGCDTDIGPETVGDLELQWFFNTDDVVTATPAVVGDTAYVGDWTGRFYALDMETGEPRWTYDADIHDTVYAGQIVGSAAVATVDDEELVFFPAGKTMYALRTDDGSEVWRHELGTEGDTTEPTEIESSPVVVDGRVIFGFDAHDRPGFPAGVVALDASTGDEDWYFDPDQGEEPTGCVGVWDSPSVDPDLGLVFAASANCPTSPDGWGPYTEAIFAVDLENGEPVWSYQPHEPNTDDFDFAGAPNLFDADGRAAVGLGNKDARYYAVDRETGELIWDTTATEPGIEERGSNFSTGGFIGPTAVADGVIVGGTAVGPCPCLHALDADTGEILWQDGGAEPTYAASAEVGGVVFLGGTDFTLRAYDLHSGDVLWSHEMQGVVAGGSAIVGNDVVAVAGLRDPEGDPGNETTSETSGVYRFSLDGDGPASTSTSSTAPPLNTEPVYLEERTGGCVNESCELPFNIFPPPDGLSPSATLEILTTPFSIRVDAAGLGEPIEWVNPESETFSDGAELFGAYLSTSDDDPTGTLVCVFDADGLCVGDTIPIVEPSYNRMTILAIPDPDFALAPATGVSRIVTTFQFEPPLVVVEAPEGN